MLIAMNDKLATLLKTHDPATLQVHDRSETGYAVTYAEQVVDPGTGRVESSDVITRELPISRPEAVFLLKEGAMWTGADGTAGR